jgi:hypothetical protein
MDLTLASSCYGGDPFADIGIDLLALGLVGLLLALKWRASRWFSAHTIAWLLSLILIDLAPDATPVPAQMTAVIRSYPSVIACGLVALILPLLAPAPIEWQIVFPHRRRQGRTLTARSDGHC